MTPEELHEARTNPDFIAYIDEKEKEVFESKSISGLYGKCLMYYSMQER